MRGARLLEALDRRLLRDETAATATEYAVMLALVLMVILSTVSLFGQSVSNMFTNIQTEIAGSVQQ